MNLTVDRSFVRMLVVSGLRKRMAKRLAQEIDGSEQEIAAVLGHRDLPQVRTYTAGAKKDQMAERALLNLLHKMVEREQARTSDLHTPPTLLHTCSQAIESKGK